MDEAIDLLLSARAANPRMWITYPHLAGALGLRGDLDNARDILAASIKLKPEVDSLARYCAGVPMGNARYWALRERTVNVGLRRAGIPDE